jgi:pimeloyl-ACP methyl ester carboxylesterase
LDCGAPSDGLVTAVAVIGSPAPADAPGLDFFAGMREEVQQDIKLFESDPVEWARQGDGQRDAMLAMSAAQLAEAWSASATPADTAVLHGRFGAWLHRAVQFGLTPGNEGWLGDDVALFHSSWGFDPAAISVPVKVWHGREDHFVPFGHGQWLADAIPGAEAELSDADGHMTVMADRISDVHEWLAQYV